jgi:hypothetical protein
MMLDMKRTFDEIVEAHADPTGPRRSWPTRSTSRCRPASRARRSTWPWRSSASSGTPTSGTSSWSTPRRAGPRSIFLDAPQRLSRFLDGRLIRLLTAPAKTGHVAMRVLNAGFAMMTSALTKILGAQVLKDAQTFVTAFDTMFGGFRERAEATYRLLQAPGTAFLVVAAPDRTRCARRPTSSSGSTPSACRSPG